MALEGGMKCVKFLVFLFNLLFALSGLVILVTGIIIQTAYNKLLEFVPGEIFSAPILLIIVGVIVFIVSFFGCCGAIKESRCMILTFAVFLSIIFILELAAGVAAYVLRQDIDTHIKDTMTESLKSYGMPNKDGVTETWNLLQSENHCCGVYNFTDWATHKYQSARVPESCCRPDQCGKPDPQGSVSAADPKVIYDNGCYDQVSQQVKNNIGTVGGIAIGIAFIQVIGITFAYCLSRSIRNQYETV